VRKRIISAVKGVEFVCYSMSYILLRGQWCHIIDLNLHAQTEDKTDVKESFYEELEHVFKKFLKYHMKILLGYVNAKVGRGDIFELTIGNKSLLYHVTIYKHTTHNDRLKSEAYSMLKTFSICSEFHDLSDYNDSLNTSVISDTFVHYILKRSPSVLIVLIKRRVYLTCKCILSYFNWSIRSFPFVRLLKGSLYTRISSLSQLLEKISNNNYNKNTYKFRKNTSTSYQNHLSTSSYERLPCDSVYSGLNFSFNCI
jgi:hypothetical protein